MAKLNIVVGSMLGASEYVADHLADLLERVGHVCQIHKNAQLAEVIKDPNDILLVVTSTHGAGAIPDNLQPFAQAILNEDPDLTGRHYGMVALGDSCYDTFCQAGKSLDELLTKQGATRLGERLEIDVSQYSIPEDAAEQWITSWMNEIP